MTRILITLGTLLCFTACTTLQPLPDATSLQPGETVRIERSDGTQLTLKLESVSAETLQGVHGSKRYSVPVSDIRSIGKETIQQGRTWTAVAIAVAVGVGIALAGGGGGSDGAGY